MSVGAEAREAAYIRPVTVLASMPKLGARRVHGRRQERSQQLPTSDLTRSKVRPRRVEEKIRPGENFVFETADLRCLSSNRTLPTATLALATDSVPAQATSASSFLWALLHRQPRRGGGWVRSHGSSRARLQRSHAAHLCHPFRPLGVEGICGSNRCALACSCDRVRVRCCGV